MNIKKIGFQFLTLSIALAVALTVSYVSAQWQGPTATPPGNNTPPPVNVGTVGQVKPGGLSVNELSAYGASWFDQGVSFKGAIGGVTPGSTPGSITSAPLRVSSYIIVDPLSGTKISTTSGGERPLCVDSTGKIIVCFVVVPGEVVVSPSYNHYLRVTGISGFDQPTATNTTYTGTHTAFTGAINVTISGSVASFPPRTSVALYKNGVRIDCSPIIDNTFFTSGTTITFSTHSFATEDSIRISSNLEPGTCARF